MSLPLIVRRRDDHHAAGHVVRFVPADVLQRVCATRALPVRSALSNPVALELPTANPRMSFGTSPSTTAPTSYSGVPR